MNSNITSNFDEERNTVIITTILPIGKLEVHADSARLVHILLDDERLFLNQTVFPCYLYLQNEITKYGWTFAMFINKDIISKCTTIDSVLINQKYKIWDAVSGLQLN